MELERQAPEFASRGVQVLAVSSDDVDRASQMAAKVSTNHLKLGYGLSLQLARQ